MGKGCEWVQKGKNRAFFFGGKKAVMGEMSRKGKREGETKEFAKAKYEYRKKKKKNIINTIL